MSSRHAPDESRQRALSVQWQEVKSLAGELIIAWPDDVPFDARKILAEHPELQACKSAVVDVAYEEFCRRIEAGEPVDPHQFALEFPDVRSSLWRLMQVHEEFASKPPPTEWPKPDDLFLGFHLLRELGQGAFSRVYLAEELDLGNRLVVVKVSTMGNSEAQALGQLQHPHIVPIYSVKNDAPSGFTVVCMPFLGSATLVDVADAAHVNREAAKRATLILQAACASAGEMDDPAGIPVDAPFGRNWSYADGLVSLAAQVADGLAYTHDRRFLHCDIKPSNILVTETGRAVLLDFNLAYAEDDIAARGGGTVGYMAPEQLLRTARLKPQDLPAIDSRTDIYCLGATLYELLSGRLPFEQPPPKLSREQFVEHLIEQRRRGPKPMEGVQIERRLSRIIEKCLAFRPEDRFQSAVELARALRRELSWMQRLRRWIMLRRKTAAAALCSAALFAGSYGYHLATREPLTVRELNTAFAAHQSDDNRAAVRAATRALQADPNNLNARFVRGVAYTCLGEYTKAHADLGPMDGKIKDPRLFALLGFLRIRGATGEIVSDNPWKAADGLYRRALSDGFNSPAVHNNLGCCLREMQKPESAYHSFQEALKLQPDFPLAHRNLLRLEWKQILNDPNAMPDLSHAEAVVQSNTASAGAFLDAGIAYSLGFTNAHTESQRKVYLSRTIELFGQAIDKGVSPQRVRDEALNNSRLMADDRFRELLKRPEPTKPVVPESVLIVNPVERLDSLPVPVGIASRNNP